MVTRFTDLDEWTSGMQPADLLIVAGRPSMGKTTFAMNVVENALLKSGEADPVFSMEMPAEALVMRMLSLAVSIRPASAVAAGRGRLAPAHLGRESAQGQAPVY